MDQLSSPSALWPFQRGRPMVGVELLSCSDPFLQRRLMADTGAGTAHSAWDIALSEDDCLRYGEAPAGVVELGGAYSGLFLVYRVDVAVPPLAATRQLFAVALPKAMLPAGFDGFAGLRFLDSFTYGNFGKAGEFGLAPMPTRS
jgi:hypothetical protein